MKPKQPSADHLHRYRYDTPSGPVSEGRCACGAVKVGYNAFIGDLDAVARHYWKRDPLREARLAGQGVAGIQYASPKAGQRAACPRCGREFAQLGLTTHRKACRGVA